MIKLPFLFIAFLAFSSFSQTPGGQQKYFPEEVKGLFIGMTMDSLVKTKGSSFESRLMPNGSGMMVETLGEENPRFEKISYLFDKNNKLYEIILDGRDHFYLEQYLSDFYGKPNFNDTEWVFQVENGVELYIWQYLDRWCIADGSFF